jgi:YidC/Oxa1 family membrane protein insertase
MGYPNYGLAIIMFTVALRVLMFPLSLSQAKSTRAMALLQPQQKKLQQQYKNDQQILNREMQALYKKYKVNPLSGCLPMLIQMPILFALFSALRNFDYAGEGTSFLWLKNMMEPDSTIVMPIIVGISSFLQSKLSIDSQPSQGTDQQKMMNNIMLYGMPVMMVFMSRNFASGLAVYWSTFNVLGFLMQIAINASVSRTQAGLKEAIEADEKKALNDDGKEEERRRKQKHEEARKAAERKKAAAERRKQQDGRGRISASNDDKGKALDFDDYS